MNTESTFSLAPVAEVHLVDAPLARVLTQVRYSRTPALVSPAGEAQLAEALGRYPVRRQGVAQAVVVQIGPQGIAQAPPSPTSQILTFSEPQERWKVTVSDTSLSIETSEYDTRDDFCQRALEVFEAVAAVDLPPVVDRIGVRYIDRLVGDALGRVGDYLHPSLIGLTGAIETSDLEVVQSVTQSRIRAMSNELLTINSGLVPAGAIVDPVVPALNEPSWLLDIDVATIAGGQAFEPSEVAALVRGFAEHAYIFFRFATTDEFLNDFGGTA
jgi:uncharacterized protein (TIGR04255 family)